MLPITIRVGLGLLAAIALLLVYRLVRNSRTRYEPMIVLSRQQLTRGSTVALVKVIDKALVLGVTEQRISLLAEADLPSVVPRGPTEQLAVGADSEPDALAAADTDTAAPDGLVVADEAAPEPDDPQRGDPDDLVFEDYQGSDDPDDPGEPEQQVLSKQPSIARRVRLAVAGSALSLGTWRDTVAGLRERTVRRGRNRYQVRMVHRS